MTSDKYRESAGRLEIRSQEPELKFCMAPDTDWRLLVLHHLSLATCHCSYGTAAATFFT